MICDSHLNADFEYGLSLKGLICILHLNDLFKRTDSDIRDLWSK